MFIKQLIRLRRLICIKKLLRIYYQRIYENLLIYSVWHATFLWAHILYITAEIQWQLSVLKRAVKAHSSASEAIFPNSWTRSCTAINRRRTEKIIRQAWQRKKSFQFNIYNIEDITFILGLWYTQVAAACHINS